MGAEGYNNTVGLADRTWRTYEDIPSLKKYLGSHAGPTTRFPYNKSNVYEISHHVTVTTTGTAAEFESTDAIAISQLPSAEIAVKLGAAGDDASTNGLTYTFVYLDSLKASHTATATGTATLNGTQVAFTPAITDFYETVSFGASAATGAVDVYVQLSGGAVNYATITAGQAAAREVGDAAEELLGLGSLWARSHTDHTDADGAVIYIDYFTPNGTFVHNAVATLDTAAGNGTDTEEQFLITTDVTYVDGVVATATSAVKDCWWIVDCWSATTPTGNCHEFLLTDAACANVDGSGGDVYGVIIEGQYRSVGTRGRCPQGYDMWAHFKMNSHAGNAVADRYTVAAYFVPDGQTVRNVISFTVNGCVEHFLKFKLEEEQDCYWTIIDTAGATEATLCVTYIIAKRRTVE